MKTQSSKTTRSRKPASARNKAATKRRVAKRQRRASYPLHKRILLHPLSIFALLCGGVFIVGWTYHILAATIVSSTVEAPPLQSAATITSPQAHSVFKTQTVNVKGLCPARSYIKLSVNGSFGGVGLCDTSNSFSIQTSLYSGSNVLTPQAFNETDVQGPASDSVEATYQPPEPPSTPNASPSSPTQPYAIPPSSATSAKPLLLSSDFHFHTFTASKDFTWQVDLEGGVPPYNVKVDWGDGNSSNLVFKTDPVFTVKHRYAKPGYYAVVLNSVDSTGQQRTMQLAALITDSHGQAPFLGTSDTSANSTISSNPNAVATTAKWLLLAWPSYIIVLLMTVSFWLGERREFITLKPRHR